MFRPWILGGAVALAASLPTAAGAATVGFAAVVANLCILTVTTPGALGIAASGTTMSSEETGGADAAMTVVATGTLPTINFSAPVLTGPSASTAGATKEISFASLSGVNQGYISTLVNQPLSRLTDTMTIKGRVSNPNGFVSGAYLLSTTVTCQQ